MNDLVPVINRQGATQIMKRISIIGLVLMAVTAMGAIAASSAMAFCELSLGYCILGKPLGAGESREIAALAESNFVLKGEVIGVASEVICKHLTLDATKKPVIIGGMPGTGARQVVIFTGCTSTLAKGPCTTTNVSNVETNTKQVMIAAPAALKGRLGTLFSPANGSTFSTIEQKGCEKFPFESTATVTGSTVALDEPTLVEALTTLLLYLGANAPTETENFNGTLAKDGLKFGGNPATIEGTAGVRLVNDELWGVL